MTAYKGDTLLVDDRVFRLSARPLEAWFELLGGRPALRRPDHAGALGPDYAATWELGDDGLLRLIGLAGSWPDTNPLTLGHLFPFATDSVVATWFTGTLHGVRAGAVPEMLAAIAADALARRDDCDCHRAEPSARLGELRLEFRAGRLLGTERGADDGPVAGGESPRWAATLV